MMGGEGRGGEAGGSVERDMVDLVGWSNWCFFGKKKFDFFIEVNSIWSDHEVLTSPKRVYLKI